MRYWLKSLPIRMLVIAGALSTGIFGCTKDPVAKVKPGKTEQIAKVERPEPVKTDDVRGTDDWPKRDDTPKDDKTGVLPEKIKEPAKIETPDDKKPAIEEPTEEALRAKELADQLALLKLQDTKKDKDAGKDPKKDKDAKDPKKDKDKDKDKDKKPPPADVYDYLGYTYEQWKKKINHPDPSVRETAMKAMLIFGHDRAYSAVPDILAQLKKHKDSPIDLSVCVNGVLTLSTIFKYHKEKPNPQYIKDAIPIYKMFLNHSQVILKVRTVQALPYLGQADARVLLDDVIKLVKDPMTWEVRKEAIPVMAYLAFDDKGLPDKRVLPLLLDRLKNDNSAEVRAAALNGLASVGRSVINPQDKAAILLQVKKTCTNDDDDHVKVTAHLTMLSLEHDAKNAVLAKKLAEEHLVPLVNIAGNASGKHNDPSVRIKALHAIAVVGPLAKPWALAPIMKMMDDSNVVVGVQACMTLIPMKAYEAKSSLKAIVEDKKANEVIKDAAEDVLDQFVVMEKMDKEKKDKEKKDKEKEKK